MDNMDVKEERIKTNLLLIDYFDMWDEFTYKSINDTKTMRYYNLITNLIDNQIDAGIRWLDSKEAEQYFNGENDYQLEVFRALEDEWDEILEAKYSSVEALLSEVYRRGKSKGYSDMRSHIRYTEQDKLALQFARDYNFGLIQRLNDDTIHQIKNTIISGFLAGDHPNTIALKILNITEERLNGSTFSPKQRATMIARTEISRVQNTGILQSYINEGYTEIKILTAEDDNVCDTCLRYAFEFNKDDPIIFENRGKEKIHNIFKLLGGGTFPPFHPLCRCTYLSIGGRKCNGNILDDFRFANLTPENSKFFEKYNAPEGTKPVVIGEKILEKELKGIVDDKYIDNVLKLFKKFNDTVFNCNYEWIIGETTKGFSPKRARTDWKKSFVYLHYSLRDLAHHEKLLTVIHNHIWGMTPLPSEKDLKLYLNKSIKYGITTNEMGIFIIKNNNKKKLSEKDMGALLDGISDIDDLIIDNFELNKHVEYDRKNDNHKYLLNEYIKDNIDDYVNEYKILLSNYGMGVKFINAKKVNNI